MTNRPVLPEAKRKMMSPQELAAAHTARYGARPKLFQAPGRVNLIGEHTDYSDGFVLPAAIDFYTWIAVTPRTDGWIGLQSFNVDEQLEFAADDLLSGARKTWTDYPAGVLWSLRERGITVSGGLDLSVFGDVPIGAGLSSSASIEIATGLAVLQVAGAGMSRKDLALACQRAENAFVGANSGIMDQFIVAQGKADHALLIDCRALTTELEPIPTTARLIICNSMVKHSVAGGEYNTRRAEIEQGVAILQRHRPEIAKLRDATEADLERWRAEMPDVVYRRCRHVITENRRTLEAAAAFRAHDLHRFGALMNEAFVSYRDDFEASCPEVDALVAIAQPLPGCYGARLTGGGFGGCTVNLVDAPAVDAFIATVRREFERATGIVAEIYTCTATDGAQPITA